MTYLSGQQQHTASVAFSTSHDFSESSQMQRKQKQSALQQIQNPDSPIIKQIVRQVRGMVKLSRRSSKLDDCCKIHLHNQAVMLKNYEMQRKLLKKLASLNKKSEKSKSGTVPQKSNGSASK